MVGQVLLAAHHCQMFAKTHKSIVPLVLATSIASCLFAAPAARAQGLLPGDLLISGSVYTDPSTAVVAGSTQLPGATAGQTVTATNDASYPYVFNNEGVDAAFGITTPVFIQQFNTGTNSVDNTINIPTSDLVTSFPSKSELSLNVSSDGKYVTFMGYNAPAATIDVSNTNTPGVNDPTNPVTTAFGTYARTIGQIDIASGAISTIATNAYSGNNGRAAIESGGNYYTVGNAGNSGTGPTSATLDTLSADTGVQVVNPSSATQTGGAYNTTVVGAYTNTSMGNSKGDQYGFSVTQIGAPADKTGKDDNFRGETIGPDGSLYVTKGSGGNGVNTVYKVSVPGGGLPTAATASQATFSILTGLPTTLASSTTQTVSHPFGIWFANSTTLYVADEGAGKGAFDTNGNLTSVHVALNTDGGLQKWSLVNGTWSLDYTLQNGLNLGQTYSVASNANGTYPTGINAATKNNWAPATDGLRNITGQVNADGTVTIYAVTSTVSGSTDNGADPNEVVAITDTVADTTSTQASGESFNVVDGPQNGVVYRGLALTPTPEPSSAMLLIAGAGYLASRRRRKA